MPFFRRRGVIEAVQFKGGWEGDAQEIIKWANVSGISFGSGMLFIRQEDGTDAVGHSGDWVVRNNQPDGTSEYYFLNDGTMRALYQEI